MPSTSRKQQRFMYAELGRAEKGEKTRTGMSVDKLKEFTHLSASAQADHLEKNSEKRKKRG